MQDRTSAADTARYRKELDAVLALNGCAPSDYGLHVRRAEVAHPYVFGQSFTLIVTHAITHRWVIYRAGPANDWVAQLKRDLSSGAFLNPARQPFGSRYVGPSPGV